MTDFLQPELTTIALCWRLERRDGVALGFTTHDRDLAIGGLVYRAAPGMLPSAISLSDGFAADTLDIEGALSSAAITGADLRAGRWDGASVAHLHGGLGGAGGRDRCRWRGASWARSRSGATPSRRSCAGRRRCSTAAVVEQTSPECRAPLGDKRCRVDMAGRVSVTRIATVIDDETCRGRSGGGRRTAYGYGRLRWLGGANSGLESAVLRSDGRDADAARGAGVRGGGGRSRRASRGLRQEPRDLRGAVRQCGELSRRAASAGDRFADPVSGGLRGPPPTPSRKRDGLSTRRRRDDAAEGLPWR